MTLSLEGKHYRSFFPLPANVDTTTAKGFGAPEFNNVAYSQPPTAQSIYIEPVAGANPERCVTGGRAVLNYRFNPSTALVSWLGRFADWSEVNALNYDCSPRTAGLSNETDTWDYAAGMEMFLEHGKSKANFYAGAIDDTLVDPHVNASAGTFGTFYREGYIRYDLVKHIKGPFSIQAQGWHRRRYAPTEQKDAWWEGENYTALQWSPHFSAIFGFEYQLNKDACESGAVPDLNGNPPRVPCRPPLREAEERVLLLQRRSPVACGGLGRRRWPDLGHREPVRRRAARRPALRIRCLPHLPAVLGREARDRLAVLIRSRVRRR